MRTFLVLVAMLTAPFALYASGCRQDTQSAFPNGPEVKNLAAGSFEANNPTIPYIPPIDPEVAGTSESATARMLAVADRQSRLSGNYEAPGLFVLPEMDAPAAASHNSGDIMAMSPAGRVYQTVVPIGTIDPLPEPVPSIPSIMPGAHVQSFPEFWSKPAYLEPSPGLAPLPADIHSMAPAAPISAPLPFQPASAPGPRAPDVLSMPDSIPGVWFGVEDEPVAVNGSLEVRRPAGESMPPPSLSLPTSSRTASVGDVPPVFLAPVLPPGLTAPIAPKAPAALSRSSRSWNFSDMPPLEAVKKALEPLPNLAEPDNLELPAPLPGAPVMVESLPSLLESLERASESMSSRQSPAEKKQNIAESTNPTKPSVSARDMYRMDVWDEKAPAIGTLGLFGDDVPQSVVEHEATRALRGKSVLSKQAGESEQAAALAPLPKIPLRPARTTAIKRIDAEIAPPPMMF